MMSHVHPLASHLHHIRILGFASLFGPCAIAIISLLSACVSPVSQITWYYYIFCPTLDSAASLLYLTCELRPSPSTSGLLHLTSHMTTA